MLVGSSPLYLAGRNAVKAVYWATSSNESSGVRMVKYGRFLNFGRSTEASKVAAARRLPASRRVRNM